MIMAGIYNSTTPNLSTFFEKGNLSNYSNSEIKSIIKEAKATIISGVHEVLLTCSFI